MAAFLWLASIKAIGASITTTIPNTVPLEVDDVTSTVWWIDFTPKLLQWLHLVEICFRHCADIRAICNGARFSDSKRLQTYVWLWIWKDHYEVEHRAVMLNFKLHHLLPSTAASVHAFIQRKMGPSAGPKILASTTTQSKRQCQW